MKKFLDSLREPLSESLDLGIIIVDDQFQIRHVNKWLTKNVKIEIGNLVGHDLFDVFDIKKKDIVKTKITNVIVHDTFHFLSQFFHKYIIPIEIKDINSNRVIMQQNVKLYPIEDKQGKIFCLITIKDISDMVLYEAELLEKNKALYKLNQHKNQMISMCSHDLKNPIGNIMTIFQMMNELELPEEERDRMLTIVQDHASYALDLIDSILNIGKIESQGLHLEKSNTFIVQKIQELFKSQLYGFEEESIELLYYNREVDLDLSTECDAQKLEQVFRNILSNAKKYVPRGGYTKIEISKMDPEFVRFNTTAQEILQIKISNDGPPIPKHKLETIFNKYEQVSPTQKGSEVGLGLAISKDIIQLHGGDIYVESDNAETAFFIQIPLFKSTDKGIYC